MVGSLVKAQCKRKPSCRSQRVDQHSVAGFAVGDTIKQKRRSLMLSSRELGQHAHLAVPVNSTHLDDVACVSTQLYPFLERAVLVSHATVESNSSGDSENHSIVTAAYSHRRREVLEFYVQQDLCSGLSRSFHAANIACRIPK